jgi:hypothetical protein
MQKDHLEILLEDIRGKFELVLEGHASLQREIHHVREESLEQHDQTMSMLKTLNGKIDGVATDLSAHRADTEAHHGVYRVGESGEWRGIAGRVGISGGNARHERLGVISG